MKFHDVIQQSSPKSRTAIANLMVNEHILDALRLFHIFEEAKHLDIYGSFFSFVLRTRCHVRIRSVLKLVSEVVGTLEDGMARITLSIKLSKRIIWIAEEKVNGI